VQSAIDYAKSTISDLLQNKMDISMLVITKQLGACFTGVLCGLTLSWWLSFTCSAITVPGPGQQLWNRFTDADHAML
jgi:hypothetical protein